MQQLKPYEIKMIVDSLHRDAQRCDNLAEQCYAMGKQANISFYMDKSHKLREIASNLLNWNNHKTLVSDTGTTFDPSVVKIIAPTPNPSISLLPANSEAGKAAMNKVVANKAVATKAAPVKAAPSKAAAVKAVVAKTFSRTAANKSSSNKPSPKKR